MPEKRTYQVNVPVEFEAESDEQAAAMALRIEVWLDGKALVHVRGVIMAEDTGD